LLPKFEVSIRLVAGLSGEENRPSFKRTQDTADGDLRDQIAQLEADIEQLDDTLERCRKAMLFSKLAMGAGAICILAYILDAARPAPMVMVAAIAAVIGGMVVYGSNHSTSNQAAKAMNGAERLKSELIDRLNFRTVRERGRNEVNGLNRLQ
jgi:hypothetical protein